MPGGSETILIAEDDKAARNLAVKTLQQAGYTVTKIILVSGYLGDRIDVNHETLQKTTFLNKPYRLPELLRTIRQLLD